MNRATTAVFGACWLAGCLAPGLASAQDADDKTFAEVIRPLLLKHCAHCHGEKQQKAGLRVDRLPVPVGAAGDRSAAAQALERP